MASTIRLFITEAVSRTYGRAGPFGTPEGRTSRYVHRVEMPDGAKITLQQFANRLRISRSTLHRDIKAQLKPGVWDKPFHRIVKRIVDARKAQDLIAGKTINVRCDHCNGRGYRSFSKDVYDRMVYKPTDYPNIENEIGGVGAAGGETPDQSLPDASPGTG